MEGWILASLYFKLPSAGLHLLHPACSHLMLGLNERHLYGIYVLVRTSTYAYKALVYIVIVFYFKHIIHIIHSFHILFYNSCFCDVQFSHVGLIKVYSILCYPKSRQRVM